MPLAGGGAVGLLNFAVTVLLDVITTTASPEPVASPDQLLNLLLSSATAVKETTVPATKVAVPTPLIPAGKLVTLPLPLPATSIVRVYVGIVAIINELRLSLRLCRRLLR